MSDRKIYLVLLGIIILFTAVMLYARHVTLSRHDTNAAPVVARYTNYSYEIKLRFPPDWVPVGGYNYDRYEGESGFFGISAGGTGNITLDQMVKNEVEHELKPYGENPSVQTVTIDGQEARLILPSDDQDPSLKGQSVLIVTYPKPVRVGGETYNYFIFLADSAHIESIGSTITFVRQ